MSRPKKKAELVEGPQAFRNFERGMKAIFQVPKADVEEAERKDRANRKRKKKL